MNTRRKFLTMLGLGAAAVPPTLMASKPEPLPTVEPIEGEVRPFLADRVVPYYFGSHTPTLTTVSPMQSFTGGGRAVRPVIHKVFHDGKWVEV